LDYQVLDKLLMKEVITVEREATAASARHDVFGG
jgi:hypothetical protein